MCKRSELWLALTQSDKSVVVSKKLMNKKITTLQPKSEKDLVQLSQTTPRALMEDGLRRVISDSQVQAKSAFKLKKASVRGKTVLMPEPSGWQQLEDDHVASRAMTR